MALLNFPNLGWKFYKEYYWSEVNNNGRKSTISLRELNNKKYEKNAESFEQRNKAIIHQNVKTVALLKDSNALFVTGTHHFDLSTTYPGLLLGTGYNHETGSKGEIKLGFYFDYTTGLPLINGSSIKGVVRSAFKHKEFIEHLLKDQLGLNIEGLNFDALFNEVFEGKRAGAYIPIYERDTFHDAYIISANDAGRILGEDAITPHYKSQERNENDLLKNPVPLLFIKVLPKVTFRFSFDLQPSVVFPKLTAAKKEKLFQLIIQHLGVGAKTNVGYGQLV